MTVRRRTGEVDCRTGRDPMVTNCRVMETVRNRSTRLYQFLAMALLSTIVYPVRSIDQSHGIILTKMQEWCEWVLYCMVHVMSATTKNNHMALRHPCARHLPRDSPISIRVAPSQNRDLVICTANDNHPCRRLGVI